MKRVTHHGMTASLVTSRKRRYCGLRDRDDCRRVILPGEQYVRSVMFANHDIYSYVDPVTHRPIRRPMVHEICVTCAARYDDIGSLIDPPDTPPG